MEAALSQIIDGVMKPLVVNVAKHVGYLTSCAKHVSDMKKRMLHLEATSIDVRNHMDANKINSLDVPTRVPSWLQDVEKIREEVESISSNDIRCCNMKTMYQVGKKALRVTDEIERLIREKSEIMWRDARRPHARVDSKLLSTSTPPPLASHGDNTQNGFSSRNVTFNKALKLLQQDDGNTRVIGLCGMGGVGKTTMMEQLKRVAEETKMFGWIVKVVIGSKPNMYSIQNAIAECTGESLTETTETLRADVLCKRFEKMSEEEGNKKILVILDDVWEKVELKSIGLPSPLPNGFKLLLTSRDVNICTQIAVDVDLVLQVVNIHVLEEVEAHHLFFGITKVTEESDRIRYQIGCEILKICGGLPLAIKLVAGTLQSQEIFAWKNALARLKNNDLDKDVQEMIQISYEYLGEEGRAIFLLCGLFEEDSNIPIEGLTIYAWGLRLLKDVPTFGNARNRTYTCVSNLKSANLLSDGDHYYNAYVKMHDLVLSFVVGTVSRGEDTWIIDHTSNWSEVKASESCTRISLTCKGNSEFPSDVKFPNLSLLRLMQGGKSLTFPHDFYEEMRKLQVIDYERIQRPFLPTSFQWSTNLRALCLHRCSLIFDLSSIGNFLSLEVLSFANSGIRKLPSTFKNLKKLRLLDLTGCFNLVIEDGVLINLEKLEELYMRVNNRKKCVRFTIENCNELARLSKNLSVLEIEFFQNIAQPKNVSFEKLERFKISMGCFLNRYYENMLRLVTNRSELLESRVNVLFEKTHVLYLKVADMNDLEDIEVKSPNRLFQYSSFYNLRVLNVSECAELSYLFTRSVAKALSKLKHLKISSCDNMGSIVHIDDGYGSETITFPKLKTIKLNGLPKLLGLCNNINAIELPQLEELQLVGLPQITAIYPDSNRLSTTFFNKEVRIPKLERLHIDNLENLNDIWACDNSRSSEEVYVSMLREIKVRGCDSLVNLFPINPMSSLQHLQELKVTHCGYIQVLFNIELKFVGEIEQVNSTSKLRKIHLEALGKLKEVWRIKGANNSKLLFHGFQDVETIFISRCECFQNLFTPATINFDTGALTDIIIRNCGQSGRNNGLVKSDQHQEINVIYNKAISEVGANIYNVAFPPYRINNLHFLSHLNMVKIEGVEVVFEINTPSNTREANQLLPYLKNLELRKMKSMTHVWKCYNWNALLIPQQQQQGQELLSFRNLTTIKLVSCNTIKYLFSPLMAKLLSNLKDITIQGCYGMEEVVSNRDDGMSISTTSTHTLFPQLHSIKLGILINLKHIGGDGSNEVSLTTNTTSTLSIHDQTKVSEASVASWFLCQYPREITINHCDELSSVIPCYALGKMQKLQVLDIIRCKSMTEVFQTPHGMNNNVDEGTRVIPRPNSNNMLPFPNLKMLKIEHCERLEHIFTFSTLESLRKLEELSIKKCEEMKVIVMNGEQITTTSNHVVFPRLKCIELVELPKLEGFFLGKNDFQWPLLEKTVISECPQMRVFTIGQSTAPHLNFINTRLGKHSLECGLNFHVTTTTTLQHQTASKSFESTSLPPIILEQLPWSYNNLIEMVVIERHDVTKMIPSKEFQHLQKLEKIHLDTCTRVEEVFTIMEELEGMASNIIRKSNQWTLVKFPNLTRLCIKNCNKLEYVFSSSMVASLLQLQYISLSWCRRLEVIVKVEEEYGGIREGKKIEFPRLKSIHFDRLKSLKGFWLGNEVVLLPSLDTLTIFACSKMTRFTVGNLATPALKSVNMDYNEYCVNKDLNSLMQEY